jgi:hypothetical protein
MPGGSQQTQTQNSVTSPWAPVQPMLQNILGQLGQANLGAGTRSLSGRGRVCSRANSTRSRATRWARRASCSAGPDRRQALGGLFGGLGLLGGTGAFGSSGWLAGMGLSDERAKDDIKPIGMLYDETPICSYRYKGDDKPQIGVMAQDVEKRRPDAVHEIGGVKFVEVFRHSSYIRALRCRPHRLRQRRQDLPRLPPRRQLIAVKPTFTMRPAPRCRIPSSASQHPHSVREPELGSPTKLELQIPLQPIKCHEYRPSKLRDRAYNRHMDEKLPVALGKGSPRRSLLQYECLLLANSFRYRHLVGVEAIGG